MLDVQNKMGNMKIATSNGEKTVAKGSHKSE